MDHFQEALASTQSTILYSFYGRYPRLTKFYLDAIPELTSASDFELIFWHHPSSRLLYVFLEPPFDAVVPSDKWCIVLTSHVRLHWNPRTTRVVNANQPLTRSIPLPRNPSRDHKILIPPTSHIFAFYNQKPSRIDLSRATCPHEAYLRLLTFLDVVRPTSKWSLCLPKRLRQNLLKDIPGTGPYDPYLLRVLG